MICNIITNRNEFCGSSIDLICAEFYFKGTPITIIKFNNCINFPVLIILIMKHICAKRLGIYL